ncbi:unnamed protein product [Merluccius merluccius]
MSLAGQSQQFYPTGVRVTVHQARNLRTKGKNGTNDAYAIIQVAKDKFSTSVDEKCIAPTWKEEASFDLPLFHPSNADRCTLNVVVMHRAQVGLDKFLGQAVVSLLTLQDQGLRKKTDWFRLVDKTGKDDKARGEVLLDIQFMRNNMSASMFDLSMQEKPRSRISKLKDKVRGKKKDGFSDSASAIVPSVSQNVSDSEGEADAQSLNQFPGTKKKSKLKTLFAPKSNLHKNISQSMSTLGTLPSKDSSLSGSRSSGLNVDSPEVKKKFKFLGHKRTGSNDSKASQGPFSLLGRHKQSASDLNSLCINGSHVYAEEAEPKSGSTLSLNSSGQGSVEDVRTHNSDFSVDSIKALSVPSYKPEVADSEVSSAILEQRRHQEEEEEEERRQAEERRRAEARRLVVEEEEEGHQRAEAKRLQEAEEQRRYREEQERRQRLLEEEEARRRMKIMDEEERQRGEERRRLQAIEKERNEEEQKAEEKKRQEEASMSERLSTLFGINRKKDEKKEEAQPEKEHPVPAPRQVSQSLEVRGSHQSTNPFEEIPLSPETQNPFDETPVGTQKSIRSPQTLSAAVFLNRTAKVSAVKPRLLESLTPEHCSSILNVSESTFSSVPSVSPDMYANLSVMNQRISMRSTGSPQGNTENSSNSGSLSSMSEKKRRAPVPPTFKEQGAPTEVMSQMERMPRGTSASGGPVRAIENPAYIESDGTAQDKKTALPLPDYETLYPQKRHGVQGQTRWDNLIAEVQQKKREKPEIFVGQEMSVDGPEEQKPSREPSRFPQTQVYEAKPISSKKMPPLPMPVAAPLPKPTVYYNEKQSPSVQAHLAGQKPNATAPSGFVGTQTPSREILPGRGRDGVRKEVSAFAVPNITSQTDRDVKTEQAVKEMPTAKPRQNVVSREGGKQANVTATDSIKSNNQLSNKMDKKLKEDEFAAFGKSLSRELVSKDSWAKLEQNQAADDLFTGKVQKEPKLEDKGMTADDFDTFFTAESPTDPFERFYSCASQQFDEDIDSNRQIPSLQDLHSQKSKPTPTSLTHSNSINVDCKQEPAFYEASTTTTVVESLPSKETMTAAPLALHGIEWTENPFGGDPFGTDPFAGDFSKSSEPHQLSMDESGAQTEGPSGGRNLLRAWVSPTEGQPVSAQNSSLGGPASSLRRPHPVKPMTSAENQYPTSSPAVKEIKILDTKAAKIKAEDLVESAGAYTQLTQEELITLVVKQQVELTKRKAKITELEEYIDNLLVRVIDEKPSILLGISSSKPA